MAHWKNALGITAFVILITACQIQTQNPLILQQTKALPPASGKSALESGWHKGAVFAEIYVRGYKDSDGDGIGDFNGLTSKLDYLADLGVRGIWLMPTSYSSDHDHGYQIENYRDVEPDFGTMEDFQRLLDEAHKRGIGIILDYVINHASWQNPIFLAAADGDKRYRDWFLWKDENPGWKGHGLHDSWHPKNDKYYYGVFSYHMPDFNFKNPEVIEFHKDNLRFWLNMGVDGFRFDALSSLVENGKDAWKSQPENHAVINIYKRLITEEYENRYVICEEDTKPDVFARDDSCGATFSFGLNYEMFKSIKKGSAEGLRAFYEKYPMQRMGVILANHDSFAGDRPLLQLGGDLQKYKAVAATQLLSPGQPYIYYGEEIGIGRAKDMKGDRGLRPPMSWTAEGGFTDARLPFRPYATNVKEANVEDQSGQPYSMLSFYKRLIEVRRNHFSLRYGKGTVLDAGENFVLEREHLGQKALVLINYSGSKAKQSLPAYAQGFQVVYSSEGRRSLPASLEMGPYEVLILGPKG